MTYVTVLYKSSTSVKASFYELEMIFNTTYYKANVKILLYAMIVIKYTWYLSKSKPLIQAQISLYPFYKVVQTNTNIEPLTTQMNGRASF